MKVVMKQKLRGDPGIRKWGPDHRGAPSSGGGTKISTSNAPSSRGCDGPKDINGRKGKPLGEGARDRVMFAIHAVVEPDRSEEAESACKKTKGNRGCARWMG